MIKKVILSCATLLFGTLLFAQNNTHIQFKNLPLNGEISSFVGKLKSTGFIDHPDASQYTKDALLKGTFAGRDNCTIRVKATPKTKVVYRVEVSTDYYSDWFSTEKAYQDLLKSYREKYSQASQCDYISYPYDSVSGWEIKAIYQNKYSLFTYFKSEGGEICIIVKADSADKAFIQITYEDFANRDLNKSETKASALDDI